MPIKLTLRPRLIGWLLLGIALMITACSVATEYIVEVVLADERGTLRIFILDLFSVNLEESIPTWYSVIILFIAALLLMVIALGKYRERDRFRHYWAGLAVLFVYLSMDEGAVIHEIVAEPLQQTFNTGGFLAFGWQLVAVPLLAILGLIYLRFILNLPTITRNLFIASAVVYAGGALVVEGFSAALWESQGLTMTYLLVATVEEMFEILGVSLLIVTLAHYYVQQGYVFQLAASPDEPQSVPVAQPDAPAATPTRINRLVWLLPVLVGMFVLVLVVALLGSVADTPVMTETITLPFYHPIQAELDAGHVLVVDVPEVFGMDSDLSRRFAYELLASYEQVTVVALPGETRSVLFAGDSLPFDAPLLTGLLHDNGYAEFVIFETDIVALFTSTLAAQ